MQYSVGAESAILSGLLIDGLRVGIVLFESLVKRFTKMHVPGLLSKNNTLLRKLGQKTQRRGWSREGGKTPAEENDQGRKLAVALLEKKNLSWK